MAVRSLNAVLSIFFVVSIAFVISDVPRGDDAVLKEVPLAGAAGPIYVPPREFWWSGKILGFLGLPMKDFG